MASATRKLPLRKLTKEIFFKSVAQARLNEGESVLDIHFKKSRCRLLTKCKEIKDNGNGVMYWMSRDCRVQDNWAMLYAQRLALKHKLPLYVCFFSKNCKDLYPTRRQFNFLMKGLKYVKDECTKLNIRFFLINLSPVEVATFARDNSISCIVSEFFPLKKPLEWRKEILENLPADIPLVEVDAHNVIPAWIASDKQEVAARTMRSKVLNKLSEYLTGFPAVCSHPHTGQLNPDNSIDIDKAMDDFQPNAEVPEVTWALPGSDNGLEMLRTFIVERLKNYDEFRNDASKNVLSNLSPWLHFGQISAARCALEVKNRKELKPQAECFLEELIVRKELSDNYCYYNSNYDNLLGADAWAQNTLNIHRKDPRPYIYTEEQFQAGETHDDIWNCIQFQLLQEGKIHGYMRMYWCKKILEWTESPEKAIEMALWLNDTYSLDGNDPNGFVGVMWSICGVHDHGWKERHIFGKVRYMVDYSLKRKFDVEEYCVKFRPQTSDEEDQARGSKRKQYE